MLSIVGLLCSVVVLSALGQPLQLIRTCLAVRVSLVLSTFLLADRLLCCYQDISGLNGGSSNMANEAESCYLLAHMPVEQPMS